MSKNSHHALFSRRSLLVGLSGALCAPRLANATDFWQAPRLDPLPGAHALNAHILDIAHSYGFGSGHAYVWNPKAHTDGTSREIRYQDTLVTTASADGSVHCSGLTFEVWWQAVERVGAPHWLSAADLLSLKEIWYVRSADRRGPVAALSASGLGVALPNLEAMRPGDIVQIWRNSGKGHSAIFLAHRRRPDGTARGLAFWSAQSSSEGIGIRFASLGDGEHNLAAVHGVRPTLPTA